MIINDENKKVVKQCLPFKQAFLIRGDGSKTLVSAENLTKADSSKFYECPYCHQSAFLRINPPGIRNCFVSLSHLKGCPIGRQKTVNIKNGEYKIPVSNILKKIDSDPSECPGGGGGEKFKGPEGVDIEDIDDNFKYIETPETIINAGSIYDLLINGQGYINTDVSCSVDDLFLDSEKFSIYGTQNLNDKPLLIITERCLPRTSITSVDSSWTWLRVINSVTGTREVYIAVKLNNDIRNRKFSGKITGLNENIRKSSKSNIVLLGNLRKIVGNEQRTCYKLYCSESAVAFRNYRGQDDE